MTSPTELSASHSATARTVSEAIVVIDLVDSTKTITRHGWRAVGKYMLGALRAVIMQVGGDYGLCWHKFAGDGYMLAFRNPSDTPQAVIQALQALAAIGDHIEALNQAEAKQRRILLRFALHYGEVQAVEGDREGPEVSYTFRLEGINRQSLDQAYDAMPSEQFPTSNYVVLSEVVVNILQERQVACCWEAIGLLALKGFRGWHHLSLIRHLDAFRAALNGQSPPGSGLSARASVHRPLLPSPLQRGVPLDTWTRLQLSTIPYNLHAMDAAGQTVSEAIVVVELVDANKTLTRHGWNRVGKDMLNILRSCIMRVGSRYGLCCRKFTGDGYMLAFRDEQDAARAIPQALQAMVAVCGEIARCNRSATTSRSILLRFALHYGEVDACQGDREGPEVSYTFRLQGVDHQALQRAYNAMPPEVFPTANYMIMSQEVADILGEHQVVYTWEAVGLLPLKGFRGWHHLVLLRDLLSIGAGLLCYDDLLGPAQFAQRLRQAQDPMSAALYRRLSADIQHHLKAYDAARPLPPVVQLLLVDDLNRILQNVLLYQEPGFVSLSRTTASGAWRVPGVQGPELIRANRLVLEAAYPGSFRRFGA